MNLTDALAQLAAGRPVLVADAEDRENEVDVVLAADLASAEWVAWTVQHTSGYLCAPLPAARADALDLPLMVAAGQDPRGTAYTVSVDAAHGVTTGISAADRARTLRVLADPSSGPEDLIRPGHVLPLRAAGGGLRERRGHTEAGVELCRRAGRAPVAAIAELVNPDGTMMRLAEATQLAREHGLAVVTIAQLDVEAAGSVRVPRVQRTGEPTMLPTRHGAFTVQGYRDQRTGAAHVALVSAAGLAETPPVRVHSECLTGDGFGSLRCDCGPQLEAALATAADEGGVVIYLRGHEGRGIGLLGKLAAYALQDAGRDTVQANLELGYPVDERDYAAAGAILTDLGINRVRLLTNNPDKVAGLRAAGIEVAVLPWEMPVTEANRTYLRTKRDRLGHLLSLSEAGR